jgi:phenylpropionate dioxygenase-like ring-hydroxylating dioxygenase large terminal subunit
MLSHEENELVTRVGSGTPLGDTMRRYWLPALLAQEIPEPDCPPVRVRLLGEALVAFRDTEGRIGLLDEFCPHRRVSLYFGRNEECGLRCVYHGWKFDVDGACVDMMNEPEDLSFKDKIHIQVYPTVEMGGIIWAYMGPPALQPPLPKFAWTQAPASHRHVSKVVQESNWLQALEGGIDTSHAPILHRSITPSTDKPGIDPTSAWVRGKAPQLVIEPTDYGYWYAGVRSVDNDQSLHIRTYQYVLPFHQLRPYRTLAGEAGVAGHIWVPTDDENCMVYNWNYSLGNEPLTDDDRLEYRTGNGPSHVDQTTFRSFANRENDYLLDRQAQKHETFTGIEGINTQDRALQETMGRIVDRSKEHLGPADRAIIQTRRLLLQAIKSVQEGGEPPGLQPSYYTIRAVERELPGDADWRELLLPELALVEVS